MILLRGIYMILGCIVVLPLLPIILIVSFTLYKKNGIETKTIIDILGQQLFKSVKSNIDFVINGL